MKVEGTTTGCSNRCFPRELRLTKAQEFQRVFAESRRIGKTGFILLFRANGLTTARLGLAISKKRARRAIDRNRLKRLVRESFRTHRQRLPEVDIVVLCAAGAVALSNRQLLAILERAWVTIGKKACVES